MWLWAAFTPPIFASPTHFPSAARLEATVPLHVLLGMGSALADTAVSNGLLRPLLHWPQRSYLTYLASELFICTFSYGLLVAIRQAMNAYRVSRAEASRLRAGDGTGPGAPPRAADAAPAAFLFNALHTVAALVRAGESRIAVRTLSELGEFLRWVLEQDDAQLVPLRRELDLLDRYLRIEQIRFQDRLITRWTSSRARSRRWYRRSSSSRWWRTPCTTASRARSGRGASTSPYTWTRRCSASRCGTAARARRPSGRQGIGLGNTRARLERLYGTDHLFELRSSEEGGAVAQLRIPYRPAPRS